MFTTKALLATVNAGKMKEALAMLRPDAKDSDLKNVDQKIIDTIKAIDPKTNETLLHQLAQSAVLNDALAEKSPDAKLLLGFVKQHSTSITQKQSNKRTALAEATYYDHRAIIDEIYDEKCLGIADAGGNIPLHYAIQHAHHELMEKILDADAKTSTRSLYFKTNKEGLFSFALAMKKYQQNPSALSLSIVNQLYFTLPQGHYRTQAVETEIPVEWSWFSKPLWQNALRMCGNRDARGQVTSIDLNLWDFIVQVVKDGLTVWGFEVDLDLIYYYSSEYSDGTPGKMLRTANATREVGLAGRTLAQTVVNKTLAANKEFMQRVNLGQAKYHLVHIDIDPAEAKDLDKTYSHDKDWMILFKDKLFYLPQPLAGKPAICKEIKKAEVKEKHQASYEALKTSIAALKRRTYRAAEPADIKDILPLLPFSPPQGSEVPLTLVPKPKGQGMTLFMDHKGGAKTPAPAPSAASALAAAPSAAPVTSSTAAATSSTATAASASSSNKRR